jgi:hypothetical protein
MARQTYSLSITELGKGGSFGQERTTSSASAAKISTLAGLLRNDSTHSAVSNSF